MYYEHKKHGGSYPIIGVNSFRNPHAGDVPQKIELIRSTEVEKQSQLKRRRDCISISSRCTRLLIDCDGIDDSQPASAY